MASKHDRSEGLFSLARSALASLLARDPDGVAAPQPEMPPRVSGSGLWLDAPDSEHRIVAADVPEHVKRIARCIRDDGVAVIERAHDVTLCRRVIDDYARYVTENAEYVRRNLDPMGREKRLVNFHLWSDSAARIGTAERVMSALDFVFGTEAAVYTSLTFKYGTQQPVHRDTPHFATWPPNMFVGAWTALEDVPASGGPLFYHPGAHRVELDPRLFLDQAERRLPDAPLEERLLLALDLYNGEIIRRAPSIAEPVTLTLRAGDTVLWHPELPHGGLPATDQFRTRWSIVFHCAPSSVQVHQHDRFFTHDGPAPPPARYGYARSHGRSIAQAGGVAFM